jgi:hypothetical protein
VFYGLPRNGTPTRIYGSGAPDVIAEWRQIARSLFPPILGVGV